MEKITHKGVEIQDSGPRQAADATPRFAAILPGSDFPIFCSDLDKLKDAIDELLDPVNKIEEALVHAERRALSCHSGDVEFFRDQVDVLAAKLAARKAKG
tara:strand:- start:143 stop:442 length:300 start_codon:yes stop_codon:yes gene_type:complete